MLKLVLDVKCGYENFYLIEKDADFPLDFLTNEDMYTKDSALFSQLMGDGSYHLPYLDEKALYAKYRACPQDLIADYTLFPVLRTVIGLEYKNMYFSRYNHKDHPFFPELFVLSNFRLKLTLDQSEKKEDDINIDDLIDKFTENKKEGSQPVTSTPPTKKKKSKKDYDA